MLADLFTEAFANYFSDESLRQTPHHGMSRFSGDRMAAAENQTSKGRAHEDGHRTVEAFTEKEEIAQEGQQGMEGSPWQRGPHG